MNRIAVIGATGQLGTDLVDVLADTDLVPLTHADADICDHAGTKRALERVRPDVVINAAAHNKVDAAETEPEAAFRTNALAVWNLAELSRRLDFMFVHVSTDYVFGGEKRTPYREDDRPNPINVYGVSKLAGEHLCLAASDRCLLIRTSGLYGVARRPGRADNFVNTMLRLATEERPIRVINDQTLTPTFTADLARSIRTLALDEDRHGLYHVTNAGECTWYEFATKVFELSGLRPDVAPINTEELGAAARRPAYSVLAHGRLREAGVAEPRPWTDAVTDYLTRIGMRSPL
jgi:dTDP-4-dehydrorhamnose reductase